MFISLTVVLFDVVSFCSTSNISQLARIRTPPIVTSDFHYVRFIGDRSIDEKDFGKIQKDRVSEMNKWARGLWSRFILRAT